VEAVDVLKKVEGLAFIHFDEGDVVRHHLVQRIIRAYDEHKSRGAEEQMSLLDAHVPSSERAHDDDSAPAESDFAKSKVETEK
jgi:phosphate starvation-inducible PhoH-like protein